MNHEILYRIIEATLIEPWEKCRKEGKERVRREFLKQPGSS
jgi:hypothetical protein